jgi:RNA polymerase primary sigma factor
VTKPKAKHAAAAKKPAKAKPASAKKAAKPVKAELKKVSKPAKPDAKKTLAKKIDLKTKALPPKSDKEKKAEALKFLQSKAVAKDGGKKLDGKSALKKGGDTGTPGGTPGDGDSPLLDMSDALVRKMVTKAKARGYVTYDELNRVLPSDKVSSEQIEDTMSMLNEMGINVIESEE